MKVEINEIDNGFIVGDDYFAEEKYVKTKKEAVKFANELLKRYMDGKEEAD